MTRIITAVVFTLLSFDAMAGTCDCPYDTDSAGRRCGGRSAWSRPGGESPICYETDTQPETNPEENAAAERVLRNWKQYNAMKFDTNMASFEKKTNAFKRLKESLIDYAEYDQVTAIMILVRAYSVISADMLNAPCPMKDTDESACVIHGRLTLHGVTLFLTEAQKFARLGEKAAFSIGDTENASAFREIDQQVSKLIGQTE